MENFQIFVEEFVMAISRKMLQRVDETFFNHFTNRSLSTNAIHLLTFLPRYTASALTQRHSTSSRRLTRRGRNSSRSLKKKPSSFVATVFLVPVFSLSAPSP